MRLERWGLLLFFFTLAAFLSAAEPLYHVLEKGETLYALARKYKVPYETLIAVNGINDPNRLKVGLKLLIPQMYKVEKGDTLYGIAKKYGVTVEELKTANGLSKSALIKPGELLVLPSSSSSPVVVSPASPTESLATEQKPADVEKTPPSGTSTPAVRLPPPVKTSARPVDSKVSWPCPGEALYLDGKLFGVLIRTERDTSLKAVANGTVVSAGPYRGFGEVVFVQSKSGYIYVYGGNETLSVSVGDSIRSGQELGRVGFDAKEGRPLAYFFVFKEGEALDPARVPRN